MTETNEEVVSQLESLGVEYVFGYPGGRVIELLDELPESDIDVVRPRDEREGSVMAEMYGRLTQNPGVLAGQGPWIGSLGTIGQIAGRGQGSPVQTQGDADRRGHPAGMRRLRRFLRSQ